MLYKLIKPNHEFDFNGMILEIDCFNHNGNATIDANMIFDLNKDAMSKEQIFNLASKGTNYIYLYNKSQLEALPPKSVYELNEGDEYWFINAQGVVMKDKWINGIIDNDRRDAGNCFLTYEEANFDLKRREIERILLKCGGRRKYKFNSKNWSLYVDESKELKIMWNDNIAHQGVIYFDTEELAQQAVAEAGVDNIKKYIFRVGE